jgi:hypothetical protein
VYASVPEKPPLLVYLCFYLAIFWSVMDFLRHPVKTSSKHEMDALKVENRIEKDFLGKREIGADVYYGIQSLRAIENLINPKFIQQ